MRSIMGILLVVSAFAVVPVGFNGNLSPSVRVSAQAGQTEALQAETPEARFVFSGGALEGIRKVAENSPSTTTSTLFVSLLGATASWFVPAGDSDLLNVGFSAECRLINAALSPANQDWVGLRVTLSRVPAAVGFPTFMQPYDVTNPMAFCSANGFAMHHANFAARVSGGTTGATYVVQVQRKVTNNAPLANPLGVLSAWLDDWKLELAAYN
jgi:hypothetical protein